MTEDWKLDLNRPSKQEPGRAYFMPLQVHQQPHREFSVVEPHSLPTVPSIDEDADYDVPQPAPLVSATV
jgi:hypothetical protein